MFGLGMSELAVILVIALLFLGPDKLPQAAKSIGKGIRDLRKSTRELRESLEGDHQLGDAMREIRSALHDDPRYTSPASVPNPGAGLGATDSAKEPEPDASADESPKPTPTPVSTDNDLTPVPGAQPAEQPRDRD